MLLEHDKNEDPLMNLLAIICSQRHSLNGTTFYIASYLCAGARFCSYFIFIFQGLFSLLRDRQAALDASKQEMTPTLLLAPIQLARWLRFYDEHVEPIKSLFRSANRGAVDYKNKESIFFRNLQNAESHRLLLIICQMIAVKNLFCGTRRQC